MPKTFFSPCTRRTESSFCRDQKLETDGIGYCCCATLWPAVSPNKIQTSYRIFQSTACLKSVQKETPAYNFIIKRGPLFVDIFVSSLDTLNPVYSYSCGRYTVIHTLSPLRLKKACGGFGQKPSVTENKSVCFPANPNPVNDELSKED